MIFTETRIDWIHRFITSYFSSGGLLYRLLEKDKRTLKYHAEPRKEPTEEREGDVDPHLRCCRLMFETEAQVERHREEICQVFKSRQDSNKMYVWESSTVHTYHTNQKGERIVHY